MGYNRAVKTDAGNELLSRVIAGETTITFTKIATSEKGISEFEIKQEMSASATKFVRESKVGVILDTLFSNAALTTGYNINTIGVYAKDSNNNEIMFSYLENDGTPIYLEAYNGSVPQNVHIQVEAGIWLDDGSLIVIDQSGIATIQFVKDYINSVKTLNIPTTGWIEELDSDENPYYKKTFNVVGLTEDSTPDIAPKYSNPTNVGVNKIIDKVFKGFYEYECDTDTITLFTYKIPTTQITIELKGVGE